MTSIKLILDNPAFIVNEILDSQDASGDACVEVANRCIELAMKKFEETFHNDSIRASIPYLQEQNISSLNGRLVRFCGLVVQEGEDDFFIPLKKKSEKWQNVGLFKNPEALDEEFPDHKQLMRRRNMQVATIPHWSSWSSAAFVNNGEQKNQSVSEMNVGLILYGDKVMESVCIGNEYEIYGILEAEDSQDARIHVLSVIHPTNALNYQKLSSKIGSDEISSIRSSLLDHVSKYFDGNRVAAEIILAHLVSKIYDRIPGLLNSLLLGHFPVNIRSEKGGAEEVYKLISSLSPLSCPLEIGPESLDGAAFTPTFNAETNELEKGYLQMVRGTHLILDETKLAECQFSEKATRNIQRIVELLEHQHVTFDFGVQSVQIKTDLPVLSVSLGKSIFSIPWSIKANITGVDVEVGEEKLVEWRNYISEAKVINVILGEEIAGRLEGEYVELRKGKKPMDENEFGTVLNLAKLLAKTELQPSLLWCHWERALEIFLRNL